MYYPPRAGDPFTGDSPNAPDFTCSDPNVPLDKPAGAV